MSRRLRLFGKKRGDRRSLPRWTGLAGEIGFSAALVVCGTVALGYLLVAHLLPEWWAHRNFVESTCQVISAQVVPEFEGSSRYRPEIEIKYVTDGEVRGPTWTYDARMDYEYDRESAEEIAASFEPLQHYPCWYNPINPAYVVVVRHLSFWPWLLLLLPAAVVAFGGYRLVRTVLTASHSVERRAHATVPASGGLEGRGKQHSAANAATRFPSVPSLEDIVNSPGTHLAYRLPSDTSPAWRTGGLVAMAAFFSGVLVVLVFYSVGSAAAWTDRLANLAFLAPLIAVDVGLVTCAVQEWLRSARCGSSRLEVSAHPFHPGRVYQLMLVQTGKMNLRRLEVQLICQEEATYSPGTDTRTAREIVAREVLLRQDFLEIHAGAAFEACCELRIPEGAMHSFVAEHNRVDWFVLVRVRSAAGGFDRRFPVCVYPAVDPAFHADNRTSTPLNA